MSNDKIRQARVPGDRYYREPKGDLDKCAFIHELASGNMRCGGLHEHHSQYTGHEFVASPPEHSFEAFPSDSATCRWCLNVRGSELHINERWHVESGADNYRVHNESEPIAVIMASDGAEYADQIVTDHARAALVPGLVEALNEGVTEITNLIEALEDFHGPSSRQNLTLLKMQDALAAARKAGVA